MQMFAITCRERNPKASEKLLEDKGLSGNVTFGTGRASQSVTLGGSLSF